MAGYRDMMELVGKFKHVPTVLSNLRVPQSSRFQKGGLMQGYNPYKYDVGGSYPTPTPVKNTNTPLTTISLTEPISTNTGVNSSSVFVQGHTSGDFDPGYGAFNPYKSYFGSSSDTSTMGSTSTDEYGNPIAAKTGGGGYQGLTPYEGAGMNHSLISPKVSSFKHGGSFKIPPGATISPRGGARFNSRTRENNLDPRNISPYGGVKFNTQTGEHNIEMYSDGGKKKSEVSTEEDFKYTNFDKLTPEQQKSLLTHFSNTEGYHPYGHLATKESGITFGSGLDAKALITEQDYIDHGVSEADAKTIVSGLKYTKKNGKVYDMAGKSSQKIQKDLGLTKEELKEHVKKIKFSNTTQSDIVSKSVDKNYNDNPDLFNKVSNFEDFTVLSSVMHFTGDSHYDDDSRTINRNKNASTKRALQISIADLMNKYDGKLTSEEFHNVIYQSDKIVDDQGGIGVRTDISHPGDESATFNRWNKELNYSLGTLEEGYEHDETKYYTINVDDLGEPGSSDEKPLTYYNPTYTQPEVLPTEGMNMTPTQDMNQNLTPSESNIYGYELGGVENMYNGVKEKAKEIFKMINPYDK